MTCSNQEKGPLTMIDAGRPTYAGYFTGHMTVPDPEIFAALARDLRRHQDCIKLIEYERIVGLARFDAPPQQCSKRSSRAIRGSAFSVAWSSPSCFTLRLTSSINPPFLKPVCTTFIYDRKRKLGASSYWKGVKINSRPTAGRCANELTRPGKRSEGFPKSARCLKE